MFYEPSDFEFTKWLESNWPSIRKEVVALRGENFIPWHEKHLYHGGWNVFGLYAFGHKIKENCSLCPQTAQLVERIPGMVTAGFSLLSPGTHIKPHMGYSGSVLRCHLGLVVPENCILKVAGESRAWMEGKCLVFDDTSLHEAWNYGETERIVLLIDFKKNPEEFGIVEKTMNEVRWLIVRSLLWLRRPFQNG